MPSLKDILALFNTDPLALIALGGFVSVLVVTLAIFVFVLTRKSARRSQGSARR